MGRPRWIEWQKATNDRGREPMETALAAARTSHFETCLHAARDGAAHFLRAFLEAAECEAKAHPDDIRSLLEAAAARDAYFARLRPQVELLLTPESAAPQPACESLVEALKEIRILVAVRGCAALGADADRSDLDPCLDQFAVHSTTAERACSIFAHGAVYSHNECVRRGLLAGTPPGVKYLLDPRRWLDFVFFHRPDPKYYAGEKVAHAHRTGAINEGLKESYQPSVRLFFRRATLAALPGCQDDGIPRVMVRDEVSLDHLAYAVFPTRSGREEALAADRTRRETLAPRCLIAPGEARTDPAAYVSAANALVADQAREEVEPQHDGGRVP